MNAPATSEIGVSAGTRDAWQLRMFRRTLKKQQKLAALLDVLGPVSGKKCLLVTCGDNNGALNWHFRQAGGQWTWADMEANSAAQIATLTGDDVLLLDRAGPELPLADESFDVVMTIDVHEHLQETTTLNRELARVARSGARVVVTTPGGDPRKLANRFKRWLRMDAAAYGHKVDGYSAPALETQLAAAGLKPEARSSYSRFFTEMLELAINVVYVKLLAKKSKAHVEAGQIAPQNEDQLKSVEKTYRLYAAIYPLFLVISQLDRLLAAREGYAVIVAMRKV